MANCKMRNWNVCKTRADMMERLNFGVWVYHLVRHAKAPQTSVGEEIRLFH